MAQKSNKKHSSLIMWFLKTASVLAILIIGAVIIYSIMPNDQKKLINGATNDQAEHINHQVSKSPSNFSGALKDLNHDQLVNIKHVNVDDNGIMQGQVRGKIITARLAGMQMLDKGSLFYQAHQNAIQDTLQQTIHPQAAQYSIKSAPDHQVYLFINGHMFQQIWLEKGLGYINVPSSYDTETSTLYTAQENAQSSQRNIWQIDNAVIPNGRQGYKLNHQAEKQYLEAHSTDFSKKTPSVNFWGELQKALR